MKRLITILIVIAAVWSGAAKNTDGIPPAPNPPRLVNDLAGILTPEQIQEKENRLVAFNDSTTNVICVVTVNDLGYYTAAEFAYEIGEQWGVRSTDDKRNGVVLLLKPRNETSGEVYIAVGYDLEAAIPDAIAKRIIETKMMPALREGDYNAAIDSALAYILPLAAGEISVERLYDDSGSLAEVLLGLFFIIIIVVVVISFSKKHPNSFSGGSHYDGGTFFPPTHYGGNWSDFGGGFGGGSFGGGGGFGGGGFGGFGGGGGFGGAGAGGRF
ncbi:MAG: TPM domain-containing protein [Bacteroidales bacterium]|nr:TPM domain-containing protein [Bacteroidales bacterium]